MYDEFTFRIYLRESTDDDDHVRIDPVAYNDLADRYFSDYKLDLATGDEPVAIAVSASKLYAYPKAGLEPFTLTVPPQRANAFNLDLPAVKEIAVITQPV